MSDPFGHGSLVGVVLAGKFRVDRLIGEGGFGVVYAGLHLVLGEPIAIKFIKTEADAYLREARILFSLSHPAIVRMYDVGALEHQGMRLPWVVLELVNGPPLDREISQRRRERRPFGFIELRQIFDPILDGLAFAHARGVLHRDIKPSNISLPRAANGSLEPKLLDFGTARTQVSAIESSLGKTGFTPLYGAPEQWDPQIAPPSPATDVYALALTIMEAATLVPPHAGANDIPTIFRNVMSNTGHPRLDMARPDLPPLFARAIERALAVRPENRFRDAGELRSAIHAASAPPTPNPTVPVRYLPTPPPPQLPLPNPFAQTAPKPKSGSYTFTILAIAAGTTLLVLLFCGLIYLSCAGVPGAAKPTTTPSRPGLSKPVIVDAASFDYQDAVNVVRTNHSRLEWCATTNPPFEGEVDLVLEVKTTDGHVGGVRCDARASKDGGVPDVSGFCSCAQAETSKWVFKKPHSDVGEYAELIDERQSLRVRYGSKRP